MEKLPSSLPALLLNWYDAGHRDLPWRQDREPYHVWLSEIMLQQTRVEAVKGYYERFLQALPTVQALADCDPDELQKLWEGLGYYSRVRNLQKAAGVIVKTHGGVFPRDFQQVRALPGIGDYTAGAVCSICFDLPTPAVDGNVLRVLSRLTADARPVTRPEVRREYTARLAEIYSAGRCGDLTQSLMELGATLCGPNGPARCGLCPLAELCAANCAGTQQQYPVKEAKKPRKNEEKTVFVLRCGEKLAVRKRPETGLLAGLWELPNVPGTLEAQEALQLAESWGAAPQELLRSAEKTHVFTHITWKMRAYFLSCADCGGDFFWAGPEELAKSVALPTAFRMFLEEP